MDAVFIATNAPGRSAFNRVERRMAPLSKDLAGLIIPHNHDGDHLDTQGRTVDQMLERRNFEYAGRTLAEVWSSTIIDTFPTIAEYIDPDNSEVMEDELRKVTSDWRKLHVREGHYFLQVLQFKASIEYNL